MLNKDVNFLDLCNASDELEMFGVRNLQDLIEYKWKTFGQFLHKISFYVHLFFLVILFSYYIIVYLNGDTNEALNWILLVIIMYPTLYELQYIRQTGLGEYFSDWGNCINIIYVWSSVMTVILHLTLGPLHKASRWLTCLNGLLLIRRTFTLLKIFEDLSPIVTMLSGVILDLKDFMTFYFIQCILFSLMLGVLGVGNPALEGKLRATFVDENGELKDFPPGYEYYQIGYLVGNFFNVMRLSMGDTSVLGGMEYMTPGEQIMLWIVLLLAIAVNCIVFMNFIVAQASATYANVSEQLENYI